MAYWKSAGLSYLQYVTKASQVLRAATKESVRKKFVKREIIAFKISDFRGFRESGSVAKDVPKQEVTSYDPPQSKQVVDHGAPQ
mmetsp:Transcript_39701/g.84577  ORF Transcript_39701/g.84577 Transcript_39701/m.84577 type:complete len:84 (+) Transcript_39701:1-252(+)|eukprot:CAMPEP_0183353394 /NCGR_PEP_ID=MMETSP0164_2-20130417/33231_1 /TAXON_ID=221442 /ORGANISM="Coccolithus pelagicus ssp braarudi, Strain PLY182g" /LENGTH=83 /DNA_ID=CAMNT_0025526061 /DNA_START=1 /DNA_END=252 /DNA_ORIENTATION=+